MNNPEAIEYVNNNYTYLLRLAQKYLKQTESAKDCVQQVYLQFLSYKYEKPTNVKALVTRCLYHKLSNYKKINKKYCYGFDFNSSFSETLDNDTRRLKSEIIDYISCNEFEEKQTIQIINKAINKLPKKQRDAIQRRLEGTNPSNDTEKANYRHGMLKIKEMTEHVLK